MIVAQDEDYVSGAGLTPGRLWKNNPPLDSSMASTTRHPHLRRRIPEPKTESRMVYIIARGKLPCLVITSEVLSMDSVPVAVCPSQVAPVHKPLQYAFQRLRSAASP